MVHSVLPLILAAVTEVYVHRTNLKGDLISIFKNDHSASLSQVKIIDERGQEEEGEGIGVLRDVMAATLRLCLGGEHGESTKHPPRLSKT